MSINRCKDCGNSTDFVTDYQEGTLICNNCGVVLETRLIDDTAEWRCFDEDSGQDPRRVGGTNNVLLDGQGLGVVIGGTNTRLTQLNNRLANDGIDRALVKGYASIKHYCHQLSLGEEVEEQASILFKLTQQNSKFRRKPHDALVTAIIFLTCRMKNQARSIEEIFSVKSCKRPDVVKCYTLIRKEIPVASSVKSPLHYAQRFGAKLFPREKVSVLCGVTNKVLELGFLEGKKPKTIAAACIYFTTLQDPTCPIPLSEIAALSSTSEGTIRHAYSQLLQYRDSILSVIAT